ncbi:MAG: transporter substrate-binding domain-containing protein, partial [Firmicutes bacterium]|nr:transporter substrate-binding domain-containing protein [Candidatus Caballimonas caccae]
IISIFILLCTLLSGCGKNGAQINSFLDLSGKTIAIETGTSNGDAVSNNDKLKDSYIIELASSGACVTELLANKIDAVAFDSIVALEYKNKYKGLKILDEKLDIGKYGFAFNKSKVEYRDKFNEQIEILKSSGQLESIIEKWTSSGEKGIPNQDWLGSNGTLKCYVNAEFEPVCYMENDNIIGLDIDIILTIAKELDIKIEFYNEPFEDLLLSLVSNEADFIASGIFITEARAKYVDFTDSYLETNTSILVVDKSVLSGKKGIFASIADGFHTSIVDESRFTSILKGVGVTVLLILSTIIIGFFFGLSLFLLVYFSAPIISKIMRKILEIFTLLPVSTWLLICYYIIFPARNNTGYLVAIFGLSFTFGFTTLKCFLSAYNGISQGEKDACITMGYSKARALRKIYFPQMFPRLLSSMLDEVIYHIRDTSIVGFIAVQDIQAIADSISAETGEPFFPIVLTAIVYMTICFIMTFIIKKVRDKLFPEVLDRKHIEKRIHKGMDKKDISNNFLDNCTSKDTIKEIQK